MRTGDADSDTSHDDETNGECTSLSLHTFRRGCGTKQLTGGGFHAAAGMTAPVWSIGLTQPSSAPRPRISAFWNFAMHLDFGAQAGRLRSGATGGSIASAHSPSSRHSRRAVTGWVAKTARRRGSSIDCTAATSRDARESTDIHVSCQGMPAPASGGLDHVSRNRTPSLDVHRQYASRRCAVHVSADT